MQNEEKSTEAKEYHYHYGAAASENEVPEKPMGSGEILAAAGKAALSVPLIMAAIFCGSMLLIGCLLIGGFTVVLGGGSVFCLVTSAYLLAGGFQQMLSAVSPGVGAFGFGLLSLACSALFALATAYWLRTIVPGIIEYYRRFRALFTGKEEDQ